jgi:hypothetical protein
METLREKVAEEIKTHILRSLTFFQKSAVHEIRLKNIVKPEKLQMAQAYCMLDT